ncbi:MAG: HDOD domain-containing protein [Acidobacteria bacterium]|nr:HDOD domain-containing protein [Acidobacteriota bacterium]MBI3471510.1 HDOD domain-containing protein [Candidatus Solibacter usitatus]
MPPAVETRNETRPWALKILPPFPQVAVRLLDILSQEDAVIKQVVELVRMDPAFGAEILRLANSAAYGFRSQIDSLGHAIVLLGTERVKALTMTVAVGTYAKKAFKIDALKRCWHHSLAAAFLTEEMAAACTINRDRAYTAGLLHDIGRLALLVGYPVEYSHLITVANENSLDIIEVERSMFDLDHCEAGRWLAEDWKFPAELLDIISQRPNGPIPQPLRLASLAMLGCHLADTLGFQAIKPLHPWTFEELLHELPAAAQAGFPEQDKMAENIQKRVAAVAT